MVLELTGVGLAEAIPLSHLSGRFCDRCRPRAIQAAILGLALSDRQLRGRLDDLFARTYGEKMVWRRK